MPVWPTFGQTDLMFHSITSDAMCIASTVFLLGLAGSAIVVLISFVEDFAELFSKDETAEVPNSHPPIG